MTLTDHILHFLDTSKPLISIKDDDIDNTSTSLTLCPYNNLDSTNVLNNSTLNLMEHFCGPTEPRKPTAGQLWVDTSGAPDEPDRLKVYITQTPGVLKFMDVAGTVIRRSGSLRHTGQIEAFDDYDGILKDVNYTADAGSIACTCTPSGPLTPDTAAVNVNIPAAAPIQIFTPNPVVPPSPPSNTGTVVAGPVDTSIPTVNPYSGSTVPPQVTGTLTDLADLSTGATYKVFVDGLTNDVTTLVTRTLKDWSLDTSTLGWVVPSTHTITVYRYEADGSNKANTTTNQIEIISSTPLVPSTTIVKPMKLRIVGNRMFGSTLTTDLSDFTAAGLSIDGPPTWDYNFPWVYTGTEYVVPLQVSTPGRSLYIECQVYVNGKWYGTYGRGQLTTTSSYYPTGPYWISGDTRAGSTLTADASQIADQDGITGPMHYAWKNDGVAVGTDSNTYTVPVGDVGHVITCSLSYESGTGTKYIDSDNRVTITAP